MTVLDFDFVLFRSDTCDGGINATLYVAEQEKPYAERLIDMLNAEIESLYQENKDHELRMSRTAALGMRRSSNALNKVSHQIDKRQMLIRSLQGERIGSLTDDAFGVVNLYVANSDKQRLPAQDRQLFLHQKIDADMGKAKARLKKCEAAVKKSTLQH